MLTTTSAPIGPARTRAPRSLRLIFTRYSIGSVLAGVASEAMLLVTYGLELLGPSTASVAGWGAGAGVNYALNRWWVWGRRGRAELWRELLPYWMITLASLVISAWATGEADRLAPRMFAGEGLRVAFVGAAFLAVYGLMFIAKFCLFHYVVFAGGSGAGSDARSADGDADVDADAARATPRSRHQVPTTTRE